MPPYEANPGNAEAHLPCWQLWWHVWLNPIPSTRISMFSKSHRSGSIPSFLLVMGWNLFKWGDTKKSCCLARWLRGTDMR